MTKRNSFSSSYREKLRLISRAAVANPFSAERDELDYAIIGEDCEPEQAISKLLDAVSSTCDELIQRGNRKLHDFSDEDRPLVANVFLFDAFHRFIDRFDEFIIRQEASGEKNLQCTFGVELLSLLTARGFSDERAKAYFEIFYQLRRSHHFIQKRIVGLSPCMRELRMKLWNNVFTHDLSAYESYLKPRMEDFSTMLLGETGTGKGAAAAAIGRSGYIPYDEKRERFVESFTHAFTAINLSQYPETLIESELFGHRKGAFTGAIESHEGVFSRCSPHGVLFLDEIAEIGVPIQIKLLKVLEERTFSPLGSHDVRRFPGRVIVATNRPLTELRARGDFRDELYYRVCSDIILFPPLRERIAEEPKELRALVNNAIRWMTGQSNEESEERIYRGILDGVGADYGWPGNVRELEQAVRRVLLSGKYSGETPKKAATLNREEALVARMANSEFDADGLLSEYASLLYAKFGTYEEVSRRMKLDRRTVKKYVEGYQGTRVQGYEGE